MEATEFDPVEYKNDFMQLAQQRPDEAADVALKWRERYFNQTDRMDGLAYNVGQAAVMFTSGSAAAYLQGRAAADREAMITKWVTEEAANELNHDQELKDAGTTLEEFLETFPEPWKHPNGKSDPLKKFGIPNFGTFITAILTGIGGALPSSVYGGRRVINHTMLSVSKGTGLLWITNRLGKLGYDHRIEALKKSSDDETEEA